MSKRRVVITGLGLVTPLGNDVETTWKNLVAGNSGIQRIEAFDTSDFPVKIGGEIKSFNIEEYISSKDARKMDPFIHLGIAASEQAINQANLPSEPLTRKRVGTLISTGIGGIGSIENYSQVLHTKGTRKISPYFVPMSISNMVSGNLAIMHGFRGPNLCVVTACASGTHSIGMAMRLIQYGDADAMVCGGCESGLTPLGLAGFCATRALSTRNDSPETASRPWDKQRDGFVLSDGAGVLVIEELEFAKKRKANILAELVGFGTSCDAYHMTLPESNGAGAVSSMKSAIADSNIQPCQINYVNAHGTSTPAGDIIENVAIKEVFSEHANKISISSIKSMLGHCLGAAGAIEAAVCSLAIRDQVAPPTINLSEPDDGCDLNYVQDYAQPLELEYALSNSFGFGGTNGTIVLKKYTP